jgi:integrase
MPLSAASCKKAKPKPGQRETVFYDSDGLELAVTRKSKTWRWRYRFAGRRDREVLGCFPTMGLADARKAASKLRMLLWSGVDPRPAAPVLKPPPAPSRLLADVVAQYIQDHTCGGESAWAAGTVRTYVSAINRFMAWARDAGIVYVGQLDAAALSRFRPHLIAGPRRAKQRGGGLQDVVDTDDRKAASTVNSPLRAVATMLQALRVSGQLEQLTSDAIKDNLKQVSVKKTKPNPLMPAQIRALLAACRKYDGEWEPAIGPLVIVMLLSGMRLGEALRLTWADVNFRELTIRVSEETKTGEERTVDMRVSPALVRLLKSMRRAKHERAFVHTKATAKAARLYLIEQCGAPPFLWSTRFSRSGKRSVPNLRSTCSSYLTNAPGIYGGASAKRSAEQLGHSIAVAEKHYAGVLRSIPKKAKTLEAAMEIEAELEWFIAA